MIKCKTCGNPTNNLKFCSPACQKKYWKLTHREEYLLGKLKYRKEHAKQVNRYRREYKKLGMSPLTSKRKQEIIAERGGKCERCPSGDRLNVHHIKPLWAGGTNRSRNLLVFCWDCHMEWEKIVRGFWGKPPINNLEE